MDIYKSAIQHIYKYMNNINIIYDKYTSINKMQSNQ